MTSPLPFVRALVHRVEIGSTSDLARSLLEQGVVELPLMVLSDRQTAGRGRGTNVWWSDEGSLTFSIGLDPKAFGLRPDQAPRIALAVAVAAVEALEPAFLPRGTVGIRWPNDLEVDRRKLAGVLPEWVETPHGPRVVLGIGLNVASDLGAAPDEVRRMATSLNLLTGGAAIDRGSVLRALLERLGPTLEALGREEASLAARWAALDTLRGLVVRVDLGERLVSGRGAGITASGGLRIIEADPTTPTILHGGRVLRD